MPSPASCMNPARRRLIKSALRDALVEGHKFRGISDVKGHLTEAGLSEELISANIEEIFDCYLGLREEICVGQQAEPSPPPSEGLPVQPSTKTGGGENCADINGIAPPVFHSDEILNISFFRPRMNNWHPAVAKICEGNISFISRDLVRRNYLGRDKQSIVLPWRFTTGPENNDTFDTRCVVVQPELLPDCPIALAENHGKEDEEDMIDDDEEDGADDGENSDSTSEPRPNDVVLYQSLQSLTLQNLSPQQRANVQKSSAAMTLEIALLMETSGGAQPLPLGVPLTQARLDEQSRRNAPRRKLS